MNTRKSINNQMTEDRKKAAGHHKDTQENIKSRYSRAMAAGNESMRKAKDLDEAFEDIDGLIKG